MRKILFLVPLFFLSTAVFGQCPDGPASKYKELAVKNNSTGNYDSRGQAYTQAAMYEIAVCACLSGQLDPKADVTGLKSKAMLSKQEALKLKPGLHFRSWPSRCKFKTSGGGDKVGNSPRPSDFEKYKQTYVKATGIVNRARERTERISQELESLAKISATGDPKQIEQQYRENAERIKQIEAALKRDIAAGSFETGLSIIEDFQTGNNQDGIYSTLALVGKIYEDQEAKKQVERQRNALEEAKRERMLSAALQMIKTNSEEKEKWLYKAAYTFSEEHESYLLEIAKYYDGYVKYIDSHFSYSNFNWASYPTRQPEARYLQAENLDRSSSELANIAERKYQIYKQHQERPMLKGAVHFINAAISKRPSNVSYHLRMAEIAMEYDANMALAAFLTAINLKPELADSEEFFIIQDQYMREFMDSANNFYGTNTGNKALFENMINYDLYNLPLFHSIDGLPNPIKPVTYIALLGSDTLFDFIDSRLTPADAGIYTQALNKYVIWNKSYFIYGGMYHSLDDTFIINRLLDHGADIEGISGGENAIENAIEYNNYSAYGAMINKSQNPGQYEKLYQSSLLPVIHDYIEAKSYNEKLQVAKTIDTYAQQEKFARYLVTREVNYPHLSDPGTAKIISQLAFIKNSQESPDFYYFTEREFLNKIITERYSNARPTDWPVKITAYSYLERDLVKLTDGLFPGVNVQKGLTEKQPFRFTSGDNNCLLCIKPLTIEFKLSTIIRHFRKIEDSAKNEGTRQAAKNNVNWFNQALNNFKKNGELSYIGFFNSKSTFTETQVNKTYQNIAGKEGNIPEINHSSGFISRPVDYESETYAHIALLTDNYPLFESLSKRYPDLPLTINRNGETVLQYLKQLIEESPDYYRYATLPGFSSYIDVRKADR